MGTLLGLWITTNINEIEAVLSRATGVTVFPRDVYYFKEIPTNIEPWIVALIDVGAVATAATFSLLPAWRAASLHPVRALRIE
jgi:lipoprotein-releasing system permease protein